MRPDLFHEPALQSPRELIVDSFAGGGGASEGIRAATGRDPDIAINHDRLAGPRWDKGWRSVTGGDGMGPDDPGGSEG